MQVFYALGHTSYYLGIFDTPHSLLAQGIALHASISQHAFASSAGMIDLILLCFPPLAWSLWYLGYPDQALNCMQEGLVLAQEATNPSGMASILSADAVLHQLCGKGDIVRERIEAAIDIATKQAFQFRLAWNSLLRGWMLGEQGQWIQGIEEMCRGLAVYRTTGAQVSRPWFLSLLAIMYGNTGEWDKSQQSISDAMVEMSEVGSCYYAAEVHRLKGELVLASPLDEQTEAESCFHKALEVSRRQKAKSLELRAATSLARLWQSQGKRDSAHELLEPVYSWFTEAHDTADLIDAKALLDELA